MTVTVTLSSEKPPTAVSTAPEVTQEESTPNRYTNGYLKTKCGKLRLAQIILSLLALILTRPRYGDGNIEYFFMFLLFNASLLTAVALWDSLNGEKLRAVFEADVNWEKLELRSNALLALLYYIGSFGMLVFFIGQYNPRTNILAGVVGMLACLAYAYNWWLLYKEQAWKRTIAAKVQEVTRDQQAMGALQEV